MENRKSPGIAFWCCVATAAVTAYLGAYGIARWQNVLIYDVKYWTAADGTNHSDDAVRDNPYTDDTTALQELLGPAAKLVFLPLCRIEDAYRKRDHQQHVSAE